MEELTQLLVQMNWTAAETVKHRRGLAVLALSFAALFILYGAMLASSLVKT
jgi:hypothetical protein